MALEYFAWHHSYFKKCEKLTDQELGRLVRALSMYSITGERQELAGRESIAFDFIADDIDRAKAAHDEKCAKNKKSIEARYERNKTDTDEYERIRTNTNVYERSQTDTNVYDRNDREKEEGSPLCPPSPSPPTPPVTPPPYNPPSPEEKEIASGGSAADTRTRAKEPQKRFKPPTVEEVEAYCREKGHSFTDPQRFVDFYASKGWMVGKNKMVNWHSAVAGWNATERERRGNRASKAPTPQASTQPDSKAVKESIRWMDEFLAEMNEREKKT